MNKEKKHSLLVVADDYALIQEVQQALPSSRFDLQIAFNQREMGHLITFGTFDAVIVDGAMLDHINAQYMLLTVMNLVSVPIFAVAVESQIVQFAQPLDVVIINRVDRAVIRQIVNQTLKIPDAEGGADKRSDPFATIGSSEFNLLLGLSRSLTEVLDLVEVLNRVVESARQLTLADEAIILMPETTGELFLRARVGMGLDIAQNIRLKMRDHLAEQVLRDRTTILYDSQTTDHIEPEYPVNALLYIPIILDGEVLGVLGVTNYIKRESFTVDNLERLQVLSSFAAVAIKNARIHSESVSRNHDLEALVQGIQALNAHLPLPEALINICQQMANILKVNHVQLLEWDEINQKLSLQARFDDCIWALGRGPLVDLDEFQVLYDLIQTEGRKKGYCWIDRRFDSPAVQSRLDDSGANGLLIIPVFVNGKFMGLFRLFYTQPHVWQDISKLVEKHFQVIKQIIIETYNNTDYLRSSGNRQPLHHIYKEFGADWCDIAVQLQIGNKFSVILRMGQGSWLDGKGTSIDLKVFPDLNDAMKSGQPIEAHRMQSQTVGGQYLLNRMNAQVMIGLPLIHNNRVYGLGIFASTITNRFFSEREVMMARALVSHAAIALENALLFHSLQESLDEIRITQEHLLQTERWAAISDIVHGVADLINNPLTTLITEVEMLLMDLPKESEIRETLTIILRMGKRAASIARNLLTLTSINEQSQESIDIVNSLKQVLGLLNAHFEHDNIKVIHDLPEDVSLPRLKVLKGRLDDVWINLLLNAHDAVKDRPDGEVGVQVKLNEQDRSIKVLIWDNGKGIPEAIQPRIFDLFFTTKPNKEGTGLGLHICREIVRSAGGTITVSSSPDQGTSFLIQFPLT
jgi:signal transduction histidine kinase